MSAKTGRTSISISSKLLDEGKARGARMGYKNFSHYLAFLIEDDLRRLPKHVSERDEAKVTLQKLKGELADAVDRLTAAGAKPNPPSPTTPKRKQPAA